MVWMLEQIRLAGQPAKNINGDACVDDIEDLVNTDRQFEMQKRLSGSCVVAKVNKRRFNVASFVADYVNQFSGDSFVPGTHHIYIKTWGCTHNNSDSEYMAGQLVAQGYIITEDQEVADLWLLNSCTVKNPAEDHFRNMVERGLSKPGRKVVVAGCIPQGRPSSSYLRGLSVIGVQQIDRVVEVVEETLKGNTVRLFGQRKRDGKKTGGASLALPKIRRNNLIEIIAISTGCLNQCTYCKTKHARGELGSYPPEQIIERARQCFQEGVVEIWLTSEDTGAYGRDLEPPVSLPELLWLLVEVIPPDRRLRLGMTNPPYILDHLEEMARILNHPQVYSFLHVPVQSGSDAVLADMRREYRISEFRKVVDYLTRFVPGVTIATDIICGFPSETEEDFAKTLHLLRRYKFPVLFINQFFARPGTPAARMQRVHTKEVKRRTRLASEFFASYLPYKKRNGQIYSDVLVTEVSNDGMYYVGHNKFYEQILVPKEPKYMGKMVRVEITSVSKFSMRSDIISDNVDLAPPVDMSLVPVASRRGMTSVLYYASFVTLLLTAILRIINLFYIVSQD